MEVEVEVLEVVVGLSAAAAVVLGLRGGSRGGDGGSSGSVMYSGMSSGIDKRW